MSSERPCPRCGSRVPTTGASAGAGLCPACLWAAAEAPPSEVRAPPASERRTAGAATAGLLSAGSPASPTVDVPERGHLADALPFISPQYRVLAAIGEGGMGVVYKAEQRTPVRRTVAVKLIKLGMDTRQVVARFEAERQTLALLSHPNVAAVYDAGATESGRPYFVMEWVPGEPITDFCDRHNYTTRQRLELFVQACEAIQHAHQKAIIHRDVKPSNLLVMLEGDRPILKVIDFGVAKATAQRLTDRTMFTEQGQLIGTPEYMSPEQAEMNALDIDTRTDIYSLGVVLYELLAGSVPFDSHTLREAAYEQVRRIIREVDPPRLCTRLGSMGDGAFAVARHRHVDLAALERELRGELEWIPLKALRKDRAERYRTATELADDIRNYITGRPLLAGPESPAYRARKFLRRNRGPAATAAAIVLLLVAGVAVSTSQAVRLAAEQSRTLALKREADRQRDDADRQRLEAQQQRERAEANERAALERLAEGLLMAGDRLVQSGEILRARQAYAEAWDAARRVGRSELPALTGLAATYDLAPPPLFPFGGHLDVGGLGMPGLPRAPAEAPEVAVAARPLSAVCLSDDGRILLTGSYDGSVRLFDVATMREVGRPPPRTGLMVGAATLVSDGRRLVFAKTSDSPRSRTWDTSPRADRDGEIVIWDYVEGRVDGEPLLGHAGGTHTLRLSPDRRTLFSGGRDRAVRVWDVETGRPRELLLGAEFLVSDLALSPDGSTVIACESSPSCRVWDLATGREARPLRSVDNRANCVAVSPDGHEVLVGKGNLVERWDARQRKAKAEGPLSGHGGAVRHLSYTRDGRHVLSQSDDRTLRIWDRTSGDEVRRIPATQGPFALSDDGAHLVVTVDGVRIRHIDLSRMKRYREFETTLPAMLGALAKNPNDPAGLAALGEWFAFRGADTFACASFERARARGGDGPSLTLARCYWKLGRRTEAVREFRRALAQNEAPADYLNLCLNAVIDGPPAWPPNDPATWSASVAAGPSRPR